jgi:hypothetical protein
MCLRRIYEKAAVFIKQNLLKSVSVVDLDRRQLL